MTAPVLVAGPTSLNEVVALDRLPRPEPHMVTALGSLVTMGGTSAGKALHLVDAGVPTMLLTTMGDDALAAPLMDQLRAAGVTVAEVPTLGPTERHLNLMDPHGGRVSIYLNHAGAVAPAVLDQARATARRAMASAPAVVVDLSDLGRALIPEAKALAKEIWCDLHDFDGQSTYHRPFMDCATVVIVSRDRLASPTEFLRARHAAGATLAICTLGSDGALGVGADGDIVHVPAIETRVVDTNGAGDAFVAGVMARAIEAGGAGHLTGNALVAALSAGAAQATRALTSAHLSPLLG